MVAYSCYKGSYDYGCYPNLAPIAMPQAKTTSIMPNNVISLWPVVAVLCLGLIAPRLYILSPVPIIANTVAQLSTFIICLSFFTSILKGTVVARCHFTRTEIIKAYIIPDLKSTLYSVK